MMSEMDKKNSSFNHLSKSKMFEKDNVRFHTLSGYVGLFSDLQIVKDVCDRV